MPRDSRKRWADAAKTLGCVTPGSWHDVVENARARPAAPGCSSSGPPSVRLPKTLSCVPLALVLAVPQEEQNLRRTLAETLRFFPRAVFRHVQVAASVMSVARPLTAQAREVARGTNG